MDIKTISEFYEAVCAEYDIKINPDALHVLQKAAATGNFTLKLSGNNRLRRVQRLSDADVLALSKCLHNNKRVTGLDLRYNKIRDEGAEHLAELLQGNGSLLSLRLSGNKIGNRGAMYLASMLQVNSSLQQLELADCDLATQSVIALSIVLKTNKALRSVDISRPLLFSHQEEWAVHFSEMLAVNSSLLELHLGKVGMSDSGMERLTEGLRLNHSLRYLDLRCNRVTRDGVRRLAEVLKQDSALEVIDLSSNRIEDEGAAYLSEAIVVLYLTFCLRLSISSNNIWTEGLLSLAQAMKANTTLTHVYIWGNHLEEPVCQAFGELLSSGRLPAEQTDVSAYEVDGRLFLAESPNGLRKHWFGSNGTNAALSSDATLPPNMEQQQQLAPLQF
uniref:Leucine rich repeat containing 34 n=1 Tax=Stegastes partitus TaxID=144197 RepID=A0A3B5AYG3_9TELE